MKQLILVHLQYHENNGLSPLAWLVYLQSHEKQWSISIGIAGLSPVTMLVYLQAKLVYLQWQHGLSPCQVGLSPMAKLVYPQAMLVYLQMAMLVYLQAK